METMGTVARTRKGDARSGATSSARSTNINLRVAPAQRALIDQAARAVHKTRTGFILDVVSREAENALLDQRVFMLSPEEFQALHDAMDAPPKPSKELRALLARKPRWTK